MKNRACESEGKRHTDRDFLSGREKKREREREMQATRGRRLLSRGGGRGMLDGFKTKT